MECPYCACELRLAEDAVVASTAPLLARTTCASPRCARELWAEVPSVTAGAGIDDADVRLLKVPPVATVDRSPLGKRALSEVVAALVIAVAAIVFALVVGFRYVAWPDPGPVRTEAALAGFTLIGAIVFGVGLLLDGTLRLRRREAAAPRIELVLLALPKGYRA
jgi:hypothetical protein